MKRRTWSGEPQLFFVATPSLKTLPKTLESITRLLPGVERSARSRLKISINDVGEFLTL